MCFNLLIITSKGHVKKVFVISEFSERDTDILFKVIPSQAELLVGHCEVKNLELFG